MLRRIAVGFLTFALSTPVLAATRMTYDINGTPTAIEWAPTAFPLRYEIDQRLNSLHPDAAAMIERAFSAWSSIPAADVRFESAGMRAVSTGSTPDRIVVSMADDLFSDQGAAAVTSYSYDTKTGQMLDADIRVDRSLFEGNVNVSMALQHEIGHVLGLDHSAVISSIMYPYVGPGSDPVELDLDDRISIATIYPQNDPMLIGGTLTGRVMGDHGGIFAAQVVAVSQSGQPVGSVLTNATGEFVLAGLPAGRYRLYAEPLDGPVEPSALQGTWGQATVIAFPTEFFDATIEVQNGTVQGNLVVTATGPIQLNPRWIGVAPVGKTDVSLSTSPATVRPGENVTITVGGDGFTSGMTKFDVLNPAFRRVSDYTWAGNYIRADYVIEGHASGAAVILVRSGLETAALTGALRVYRTAGSRSRSVRH